MAPKLQEQSASLQEAPDSPLCISTDASLHPQNLHESSTASDAFPLSPCSRPSSASDHPSNQNLNPRRRQSQHCRSASDSSSFSLGSTVDSCGHADSCALPFNLERELVVSSTTMAQPVLSRHPTHDAWANRLEQRAEHYSYPSHSTPLTPPSQHIKQSSTMRVNGASSQYPQGVSTPAHYALGQSPPTQPQFAPYNRSSPTPVTPNFNDFSMDSVIASPETDQQQPWNGSSTSPFDLQLDASQQQSHQSHHSSMSSFDESRGQQWWPPASSGATSNGNHYGARTHRQTSAPAMPPSQTQYGSYYPASTSSGLMINTQPGVNEMGPPSMPYATSAPVGHGYPRHPSMPHLYPTRRPSMQLASSGTSSAGSSGPNSRRASQKQQRIHGRSKSSASPPRQSVREVGSSGNVGFVNFTPSDSKRILTGVAPSGSSKTKARREKEARDRRKQLSEAAQRAVMEAGGDVTALERSGLFA